MFMKKRVKCLAAGFVMIMAFCISGIVSEAASPSNVTQIDASNSSVKIQWTGVSGAKYYGYKIASDPAFQTVVKEGYTSTDTSAAIYSLNAGTAYYVKVGWGTRYNDCFKEPGEAIEVVTAPSAISAVKFVGANDTTATVSWTPSAGATEYRVQYNGAVYTTTANSYAVPLVDGANNRIEVFACKKSAKGYLAVSTYGASNSSASKLTTKISKSNFGILTNYSSIGVVYFGAICYGNGYEVQGQTLSGKKYQFSGSDGNSSIGVRISGIKNDKMYKYRIRAYITNSDGQKVYGGWSDYRLLCNQKKVSYISSGKKIKLKWNKQTGVSKIKIQISTKEKSGYKTCATISGKKTSYTITKYGKKSLKSGKTYYVRVVPQGKLGKKNVSSDTWIYGKIKVK